MPREKKAVTRKSRSRRKNVARRRTRNRAHIAIIARDRAAGKWFEKLVALQARLRGPNGCPWDREQTHASLRKYLIEETYEVLDAMESGDPQKFAGELGDLLLQIVFHSILAEETGSFTISDVIESVHSKMIRRHPHVFGGIEAGTSASVLKNWERIKAEERANERAAAPQPEKAAEPESIVGGVPLALPAVLEAYQLTRRASHVGFDWDSLAGIFEKLDEERREIESTIRQGSSSRLSRAKPREASIASRGTSSGSAPTSKRAKPSVGLEEEVGDLLFSCVNVARFLGVDPEIALKAANRKFKRRFQWMESAAAHEGKRFTDLPRDRMEQLWNESKR